MKVIQNLFWQPITSYKTRKTNSDFCFNFSASEKSTSNLISG